MKKIALVLAFLVLGNIILFAGGAGDKPAGGVTQETVSLLLVKDTVMDGWNVVLEEIEKRLNIKTEVEIRVGGGEGETIVKTRLATGDMNDIFSMNTGSKINDMNPERNLLELDDQPFVARLQDAYKTAATATNGRLYAIPDSFSANYGAIMYNKKIYADLGLTVPKTWKEFLDNCEKIKAAGKTAVIGSYKDTWTSQLVFLQEEYYIKKAMPNWPQQYTANKANYSNTPAALRSFEKLVDIAPYLNRDYLATTLQQAMEMLATGEGAHYPMQIGRLTLAAQNTPELVEGIGAFAQPGDDPNNIGSSIWMPGGLYTPKNSKKTEAVLKWMNFWVSAETYNLYAAKVRPTGPAVLNGITLPADVFSGVKDMAKYGDEGKIELVLEFESPIKGPNLEQLCIEVVSGRMTPAAAAVAYDQDVTKQAVLLNLPGW
jgi:raffinose/stachyose/melibiose transport system substrate-binding protein